MPAGQEYSGFLKSYDKLKPNPRYETTVSFVSEDPVKNVHKYVAIILEPPVVYIATDADASQIPEQGRKALAEYFQVAIAEEVEDALPIVQSPGPLVLRLRSALIGVDVGPATGAINIGKVAVEMELVDSETGEQIAAAVDRQDLGEAVSFSREEKFRAATRAVDGWAKRLRAFLDSAHERSAEDVARIESTNFPFAQRPGVE